MTTVPDLGQRALAQAVASSIPFVERELEWFFGKGQSLFERSSFGRQLEEARRTSSGSRRCIACNRQHSVRDEHGRRVAVIDPQRDGGTPGILADGSWCPKCGGTGLIPCTLSRAKRQLTAQLTGHEVRDHGYVPADADLRRHARASRWLMDLEVVDLRLGQAVTAYYGNDAGMVSQIQPWGAWLAVGVHCSAGELLLLETYRPNTEVSMRKIERIRVQATLEGIQPQRRRRVLLDAAAEQGAARLHGALNLIANPRLHELAESCRRQRGAR